MKPGFASAGNPLPIAILGVLVLSLAWLAQSLFFGQVFVKGDFNIHLRWAEQFAHLLGEGWLVPRWTYASHRGLGDPTFLYYQPLFYYVSSAFVALGLPVERAVQWAGWVPFFLIGLVFVVVQRQVAAAPQRWILAAFVVVNPALFMLASQVTVYPWMFSAPFCLLFVMEAVRPAPRIHRLAAWLALVCLAHILSGFIVLLCVSVARLVLYRLDRDSLAGHVRYAIAIALGLGLTAYYLYPALTEQALINPGAWSGKDWLDWRSRFLFPIVSYFLNGMSWFALQWLLPALFLLLAGLTIVLTRPVAAASDRATTLARRLAIVGIVALLFGSELGYPLWLWFPPMLKLQQPYRFVVLASLCVTFAFALLAASRGRRLARNGIGLAAVAVAATIVAYGGYLQFTLFRYGTPSPTIASLMTGDFGAFEYLPATRGDGWAAWVDAGGLEAECARLAVRCEVGKPMTQSFRARFDVPEAVSLRLPVFAFPAWRVEQDGTPVAMRTDPQTGLIAVALPSGRHTVGIDWTGIAAERTGRWITGAAAVLYLLTLFGASRRRGIVGTG